MASNQKLTAKQSAFADTVAAGKMTLSEAYRTHYKAGGMKPSSVHAEACRVAANRKVSARIDVLKARLVHVTESAAISDKDKVLTKLRHMMDGAEGEQSQLRAAELLGRSCGLFKDVIETVAPRTASQIRDELRNRLEMLNDDDPELVH